MKKIKRVISLFLTGLLVCSALASCGVNGETNETEETSEGWNGRGVHTAEVTQTNSYLIKNGATDYKILLPAEPTEYETEAALLINEFIEKSSDVKFPIVYSTGMENANTGKYISLGDTSLMRKSGIAVSTEKYGSAGFRIVTKADDVYISGARNALREGTYFGAQDFLYHTIGWTVYAMDEIVYDIKSDVKLCDYNVDEVPEFDSRRLSVMNVSSNDQYMRYMRLELTEETRLPFSGHSHYKVLPFGTYYPDHPDWYGIGKNSQGNEVSQLCLSNEEMTQEFIKQLAGWFQDYPNTNFVHIGQQDNQFECPCDNCNAMKEKYNTNYAGLMVMFTNKVARGVTEIIQRTEPDRELQFEMFAYYKSIQPPASLVDGKYVPNCPEVVCDDNVLVQFTPLGYNASYPLSHQQNETYYGYLLGWEAVCKNISTWFYDVNFYMTLISHKMWDTITADLRTLSDHGVTRMYYQGMMRRLVPQMTEMRVWVYSKLMWNPTLNYQDLVEEFIAQYYGPQAGPYILDMYNKMTNYYDYVTNGLNLSGSNYLTIANEKYWSFSYVESIRLVMEDALASLEELKIKDEAAYEKYYWRVCAAYVENLFMQMQFYRVQYGKEYSLKTIDFFEEICQKMNYTDYGEGNNLLIANYIKQWRATYV